MFHHSSYYFVSTGRIMHFHHFCYFIKAQCCGCYVCSALDMNYNVCWAGFQLPGNAEGQCSRPCVLCEGCGEDWQPSQELAHHCPATGRLLSSWVWKQGQSQLGGLSGTCACIQIMLPLLI